MGASRKFYFGDAVKVIGGHYSKHVGHLGRVAQTTIVRRIKSNRETIMYDIACECGKTIRPVAPFLEQIESDQLTLGDARMRYFLGSVGAVMPDDAQLRAVVSKKLSTLKPEQREIIELRFGLVDGPQTYQAIGELLECSRQYVHQMATKALKKIAQ